LKNFKNTSVEPSRRVPFFEGVDGKDVYNITAPFSMNSKAYIAGRVDPREKEGELEVRFF